MLRPSAQRFLVFLLMALLLALGAGVAVAPAAEPSPDQPTEEPFKVEFVEEGPEEGPAEPDAPPTALPAAYEVEEVEEQWTMWDGIKLPVSVFSPLSDDAGEVFPVIVFIHPWDCDKVAFEYMAMDYARRGYVCVTYTVRGWYGAEGQIGCMDPEFELKDLSYIITLVSGDERFPVLEDEKGPVVGVTGYSMGGCHSFLIAPRKNPRPGDPGDQRVRAVVPMHGGADLLYSIYPNGAVKFLWGTFLLMGSYMGNLAGFMTNVINIAASEDIGGWDKLYALIDAVWKLPPLINDVTPELARIYGAAIERRVEDWEEAVQFMRLRSARYWCDQEYDGIVEHPITVPMLILAGWNDDIFYANEGLSIFSSCIDAPKRMIITNHGHLGGMVGDFIIELPENTESEWILEEIERWFDHYLKGLDNGVEDDPRLVYYRDLDPENYGEADDFPLPGTQSVAYYLGDGAGGKASLSVNRPRGWFSWPDVLVNIGITGSVSLPYFQDVPELFGGETMDIPTRIDLVEIPFTICSYTTEPLTLDVTVMGAPTLEVYYQSSQPFTQLIPWLYEVTPDGEEILISRGWYEGYDEEVWTLENNAGQPVEMQACYHNFHAGSRIKLEIATADLTMTWSYWNLAFILLHHSKDAPSRLILPVI